MKKYLWAVILLLISIAGFAFADSTPVIISFQGQLRENSVPVSGNKTMHFRILDVSSNIIWQSDASQSNQVTVAVANGIYTVGLGDTSLTNMAALTKSDIDQNKKLYLRVRVGIEDLAPDILLSAVPFAYIAKQAETITQNISAGNSVVLALRQATQNVGLFNTSPTGVFQVSSNYFVVSSNGRVGIATATPAGVFQVSSNYFVVSANGNIGIADSNPSNLFEVSTNYLVVSANGNIGVSTSNALATLVVDGGLVTAPSAVVSLTADNQLITVGNRSFITISSNNGTATARTFCLTAGKMAGHILYIYNTNNGNSAQLIDGAQSCVGAAITTQMNGNLSFGAGGDTVTLIYDGANWSELGRGTN